jgi:hypothetical protein
MRDSPDGRTFLKVVDASILKEGMLLECCEFENFARLYFFDTKLPCIPTFTTPIVDLEDSSISAIDLEPSIKLLEGIRRLLIGRFRAKSEY